MNYDYSTLKRHQRRELYTKTLNLTINSNGIINLILSEYDKSRHPNQNRRSGELTAMSIVRSIPQGEHCVKLLPLFR